MNSFELVGLTIGTFILVLCVGNMYGAMAGWVVLGSMLIAYSVANAMFRYLNGKRPE